MASDEGCRDDVPSQSQGLLSRVLRSCAGYLRRFRQKVKPCSEANPETTLLRCAAGGSTAAAVLVVHPEVRFAAVHHVSVTVTLPERAAGVHTEPELTALAGSTHIATATTVHVAHADVGLAAVGRVPITVALSDGAVGVGADTEVARLIGAADVVALTTVGCVTTDIHFAAIGGVGVAVGTSQRAVVAGTEPEPAHLTGCAGGPTGAAVLCVHGDVGLTAIARVGVTVCRWQRAVEGVALARAIHTAFATRALLAAAPAVVVAVLQVDAVVAAVHLPHATVAEAHGAQAVGGACVATLATIHGVASGLHLAAVGHVTVTIGAARWTVLVAHTLSGDTDLIDPTDEVAPTAVHTGSAEIGLAPV